MLPTTNNKLLVITRCLLFLFRQEDTDKQLDFSGCLLQEADVFLASLERLEQMDQLVLGGSQKFDL